MAALNFRFDLGLHISQYIDVMFFKQRVVLGSHRPHVALLKLSTFSGIDESPPDGQHGQFVAAVLPPSEVLVDEQRERHLSQAQ